MVNPILVGCGITGGITVGGLVYSLYDTSKVASVKLRTEDGEFEPTIETPRKKHGLIVSHITKGTEEHIRNTINLVHQTLVDRGFNEDDIYLLEGKKKTFN